MRPIVCGPAAALIALPASAREPTLAIGEAESRAMSHTELATLTFGAAADQVVAAEISSGVLDRVRVGLGATIVD